MIRRLIGLTGAVAASALLASVPAGASPTATAEPVECHYTMSAPYVVDVAGTPMVTATVMPAKCPAAVPSSLEVCVSIAGKAGRCAQSNGNITAQVYLSPYVPGQTYSVRGRGCAGLTEPPTTICSSLGPAAAVL